MPVARHAESDPDSVISAVVERVGGHGRWESQELEPRALWEFPIRLLGFAAVSGGTAFAFAGVFSFAGMGALRVRHRLKSDSRILTLIHPFFPPKRSILASPRLATPAFAECLQEGSLCHGFTHRLPAHLAQNNCLGRRRKASSSKPSR